MAMAMVDSSSSSSSSSGVDKTMDSFSSAAPATTIMAMAASPSPSSSSSSSSSSLIDGNIASSSCSSAATTTVMAMAHSSSSPSPPPPPPSSSSVMDGYTSSSSSSSSFMDENFASSSLTDENTPTLPAIAKDEAFSSYIQLIQHLIERCLILNMDEEECADALASHAAIPPLLTSTVWKELEKRNPHFFLSYLDEREERRHDQAFETNKELEDNRTCNAKRKSQFDSAEYNDEEILLRKRKMCHHTTMVDRA